MQQCKINALLASLFLISTLAALTIGQSLSENAYTPVQWRDIKQQEFERADAAYTQASSESEQARELYNGKLKAKADAATNRAKALSALNIAKSKVDLLMPSMDEHTNTMTLI